MVGVIYVLRIMIPYHMDPTIMLAFGEDAPDQAQYARALIGHVTVREAFGHDGQVFFVQANDPWFLQPDLHAVHFDRPVYRAQRMGYPTIAAGFGLFPPAVVAWTLPLVNICALAAGCLAASRLARLLGGSSWLGLAFCLNPGVLSEVDISGGGVLALAFGTFGVLAAEREKLWPAAATLTGAALSRETMLAFAAAVAWILWRRRIRRWWLLLAVPVATAAAWAIYVRIRLGGLPSTAFRELATYPFAGPIEAFAYWRQEPLSLLTISAFLAVCTAFAIRVVASRQILGWAALPSLLIASGLSVSVWRFPYDIARALAPVLLAYPLLAFIEEPKASREELVAFQKAVQYVIAETRRLHRLGLSPDDALKQAKWGEYTQWMLADQQGIVAIRKIYEELEGTLK